MPKVLGFAQEAITSVAAAGEAHLRPTLSYIGRGDPRLEEQAERAARQVVSVAPVKSSIAADASLGVGGRKHFPEG